MTTPGQNASSIAERRASLAERRAQLRGLLFLAVVVLLVSIWRAGVHTVFLPNWWHLW